MIIFQTNKGDITIALDTENTPKTAENFLNYVKSGFYEGTIFHRVIAGFMIQGGGFDVKMVQKPGNDPIQNEADKSIKNVKGTIAMARTSDPHSASSQFFINVKDNNFLNHRNKSEDGWGYCCFGQVVEGMSVVEEIEKVGTGSQSGHQDVPQEPIIIEKVLVKEVETSA